MATNAACLPTAAGMVNSWPGRGWPDRRQAGEEAAQAAFLPAQVRGGLHRMMAVVAHVRSELRRVAALAVLARPGVDERPAVEDRFARCVLRLAFLRGWMRLWSVQGLGVA
jgi:hypothetical protein